MSRRAPYERGSRTSRAAARKIDAQRQMRDVKAIFLATGPLADFEGVRIFALRYKVPLDVAVRSYGGRRRGLVLRGDLVESGERRFNPYSDRWQGVYRLREPGDPPPPVEVPELRTIVKRLVEAADEATSLADLAAPLAELRACIEAP